MRENRIQLTQSATYSHLVRDFTYCGFKEQSKDVFSL